MIKKIIIENFKCINDKFELDFKDGINILVGNNEAGKSTILEAIHLALSGIFRGKPIRGNLSQYLFNYEVVNKYLNDIVFGNSKMQFLAIKSTISQHPFFYFINEFVIR